MSRRVCCPIGDLLQKQISEFVHACAKAMLEMLQVPDVRSEEYREASKRSLRAQAKLSYLKHEIEAHCQENKCGRKAAERSRKMDLADMAV